MTIYHLLVVRYWNEGLAQILHQMGFHTGSDVTRYYTQMALKTELIYIHSVQTISRTV